MGRPKPSSPEVSASRPLHIHSPGCGCMGKGASETAAYMDTEGWVAQSFPREQEHAADSPCPSAVCSPPPSSHQVVLCPLSWNRGEQVPGVGVRINGPCLDQGNGVFETRAAGRGVWHHQSGGPVQSIGSR